MTITTIRAAGTLLVAMTAGAGSAALGQAPGTGHQGMPMPGGMARAGGQAMGASDHEMMAAIDRMNKAMTAPQAMTGDLDRDFVAMMTPHHQGAIDMARLYLRDG